MANLRAGAFDRLITVRNFVRGVDSEGVTFDAWADAATIPASKRVLKTDSKNLNNQDQPIADVEFMTYWTDIITANSQIFCENVLYEVVGSPQEIGRREGVKIQARTHRTQKVI